MKYVALSFVFVTMNEAISTCGQLALTSESKMNNKKKRRLEKYIVRMPTFTLCDIL